MNGLVTNYIYPEIIMLNLEQQCERQADLELPSFSIVYETENLSSVELENIYHSLASLATQEISPEQANEFLIVDSGNAPAEVIEDLCSRYPWITVEKSPGISYYTAKMQGATLATGEIIVYCDSDCTYGKTWLRDMLVAFAENPEVDVVAGETSTPVRNVYELAIAMHYFFPRFSGRKKLYKSNSYFLNNVAFRRNFLLKNPIPSSLPLYRGNCVVHAYELFKIKGHKIWKNPHSRTLHEPPTPSFSFWRYLLKGRDRLVREYLLSELEENKEMADCSQLLGDSNFLQNKKFSIFASTIFKAKPFKWKQIRSVLKEDRRRLFLFPLAIPIMLWFELLHTIGIVIAFFQPDLLPKLYYNIEGEPSGSVQELKV
ncbi:MAG: glycosyltransferase family 2 protein [Leptolyngbya sp. SIO1E4]|nr:glycosyltransferase family 2 protein [Leptolyngbya sp. SIO1E4]